MPQRFDRLSQNFSDALLLIARVLMAYLFIPGGFQKLTHLTTFASSLAGRGIPESLSFPLACLGAATEFFGSLAVLVGFQFKAATLLMACFTIVATLISHRYWEFQDAARAMQTTNFNKNLGIIGGLLALFVAGAGRYSLSPRRGFSSVESSAQRGSALR